MEEGRKEGRKRERVNERKKNGVREREREERTTPIVIQEEEYAVIKK